MKMPVLLPCFRHYIPRKLFRARARHTAILLACVLACPVAPTQAADEERPWHLGIALGAGQRSNPLMNSDDIDINAVIDFAWYGKRFFFDNGDLGVLLHENNRLAINVIATFNNERNYYNYLTGNDLGLDLASSIGIREDVGFTGVTGAPDDDTVDGGPVDIISGDDGGNAGRPLEPDFLPGIDQFPDFADAELPGRDTAINAGLEFLYISPWGDLQGQLLTDVSNTHDGQEAWLSWSKPWFFATRTGIDEISLTLGLEWKSRDLVGYYYGVDPDEILPGRPGYGGGSGTNAFVRLSASHSFSPHWKAVSMLEREYLSSAITDSPVVRDDHVDTWYLGLFYRF